MTDQQRKDGQTDGRTDSGRTDRQTDGRTDGQSWVSSRVHAIKKSENIN